MIFICRNKECKKYGVEDYYSSVTHKFVNGQLIAECAPCPCCGRLREEINTNREIPLSDKSIYIGRYSSKTTEEKREILKKRSHEHYEKEIKPYKEYKINELVNNFKQASKD